MKNKKGEESELEEAVKEVEEEEELKEIAEEISDEDSDENSEEFDEFIEFPIQPSLMQDNSPSLERINIAPETSVSLEQGLPSSPRTDKDDSFKYSFSSKEEEEPKYSSQSPETLMPKAMQIENLGRGDFAQTQEVGFVSSNEIPKPTEEYLKPENQNIENLGRNENPFERKEIKYKPTN